MLDVYYGYLQFPYIHEICLLQEYGNCLDVNVLPYVLER